MFYEALSLYPVDRRSSQQQWCWCQRCKFWLSTVWTSSHQYLQCSEWVFMQESSSVFSWSCCNLSSLCHGHIHLVRLASHRPCLRLRIRYSFPRSYTSYCCSEDDVHTTWVAAAEPSQCQWHINTNSSLAITPRRQSYLPCFVILFPFINKRIRYLCKNFFLFSSCSWRLSAFNMVAEHSARQS